MEKFLVMHRHSWGTGETLAEAAKISRQNGGRGRRLLALRFDAEKTTSLHVDQMGRILYNGDQPVEVK